MRQGNSSDFLKLATSNFPIGIEPTQGRCVKRLFLAALLAHSRKGKRAVRKQKDENMISNVACGPRMGGLQVDGAPFIAENSL